MSCHIAKSAQVCENVDMGYNVIIEENVKIEKDVKIGSNVIIKKDTKIDEGCIISDNTILGKEPIKAKISAVTQDKDLPPLVLGKYVVIGSNCVIYRGSILSQSVFLGDYAFIREEVTVGENTIIGKGVTVENKTYIGKNVKIETGAYITAISTIEDHCFVAPEVTFTNDRFLGRTEKRIALFKGPTIKKGARIGANATILPGIVIGEDALVGAGSVVTKNLEPRKIYIGVPARETKKVPDEELLENQNYYISK